MILSIAEKIDVLGIKELGKSIATYECINILSNIKKIGLKPFLEWAKEKDYEVWKDTKDDKILAETQNKSYLNFTYGNYVVVIPTTVEEFRKEAFEQGNCVYSTYMPYVVRGRTNIVFIRKVDQIDKSFITCEIDINGNIRQYLLAHNRIVEDKELLAFKELYQNHILNNINK